MLPLCLVQVDSLLTFLWCRLLCARRELRSSTGAPPPGPAGHSATAHHPELPAPGFAEAATFRGESARPDFPAKPHRPRGRVGPGTPRPALRWRSPYPGTLRRARAPRPGARPNREHPRPGAPAIRSTSLRGAPQIRSTVSPKYTPARIVPNPEHPATESIPHQGALPTGKTPLPRANPNEEGASYDEEDPGQRTLRGTGSSAPLGAPQTRSLR